jgi:hypothetical protein
MSHDEELNKAKDKIRKLLNLAEDAGAMKGEIDNAMRFARTLMLQHNLSEEEVRADAAAKSPHEIAAAVEATEFAREALAGQGSRLSTWETTLGHAVMDLVGTVKWYLTGAMSERRTPEGVLIFNPHTGQPVQAACVVFYGPAEDVAAAKALMYEWSLTIVGLARLKFGGALRGAGRAYAEGFATALEQKVAQIRREEEDKAKQLSPGGRLDVALLASGSQSEKGMVLAERGSALALANANALALAKQEAAVKWLKEDQGVKLHSRSGGGGGSWNPAARSAGLADGRKAAGTFQHSRRPKLGGGA